MGLHTVRKGLDLPIQGAPEQKIGAATQVSRVALIADDFPGMKPRMLVNQGDTVRRGQPLFEDRKQPGVMHTAPGAGTILAVHRGAKRVLQSVTIELTESERSGTPSDDDFASFASYTGDAIEGLERQQVVDLLVESGLWAAFRTRPFSHAPPIDSSPRAIFVNAMDTNPLAARPEVVLGERREDLDAGLVALTKLTEGHTYLCAAPGAGIARDLKAKVRLEEFKGPHPAGTSGLHIHTLQPVSREQVAWSIHYQEVLSIGALFRTGKLSVDRVVALAGPAVKKPRLLRTRLGACIDELVEGELGAGDARVISGSVLSGKASAGEVFGYMSRHHLQVSALAEAGERRLFGWLSPGLRSFSTIPIYLSGLLGLKKFDFTTDSNGSIRAMVPIGMYERVMPLDILPTFLLRSLMVGDVEQAEKLGVLELDEEDLALCTFVCPGKHDYGPMLRENLERICKEG